MYKYGIAIALLAVMAVGFQNCSTGQKGDNTSANISSATPTLVFNTYDITTIKNIKYEHLGGFVANPSAPHPTINVSLNPTTQQMNVAFVKSDGSGSCSVTLGAIDYAAYTSGLVAATLGTDTSSSQVVDAGDLHLEMMLNGSSNVLDFIFQGGDNSHSVPKVILNADALRQVVSSYLNVGCNVGKAFQTVDLASLGTLSYFNSAKPQGADPARRIDITFLAGSPVANLTKTLTNSTTTLQITQCSRPLTESEMIAMFSNLRAATLGVDSSHVVISTAGDNHLIVQAQTPTAPKGAAAMAPVAQDFRFQGGDTTHIGSVIFGNDAQQFFEYLLDTLECPVTQ